MHPNGHRLARAACNLSHALSIRHGGALTITLSGEHCSSACETNRSDWGSMNADSAFVIGRSHAVCQDYAVAGFIEKDGAPNSYTIVADGCSSSPDTDIGARLLVKAAQRLLLARGEFSESSVNDLYDDAIRMALKQARLIDLSACSIDATLLTVYVSDDRVTAACYGDGTIALQSRCGDLDVYSISFADSRPRYPSYSQQPERLQVFEKLTANAKHVSHLRLTSREGFVDLGTRTSVDAIEVFNGDASDYEYVAVITDGVESFVQMVQTETTRQVERVESERILRDLLGFKSFCGAFVKRRLSKFLTECHKKDWRNNDDLAVGVVYVGSKGRQ